MEQLAHGPEGEETNDLVRDGLYRIVLAGGVGMVLYETSDASTLAYLGVFLSLAFGSALIPARPRILEDGLFRLLVDVFAITLVVAGSGPFGPPYTLLYFIAALGVFQIDTRAKAVAGALSVVAGYLVAAWVSGTLTGVEGALRPVLLAVFCATAWGVAAEVGRLREEKRALHETLSEEREYANGASGIASSFAPVLGVLDLRGILGWTAETAREISGASYAHVVLLDGNQHVTIAKGDADICPTWWHPDIQALVLGGSRNGGSLHEKEKEVHGIGGFLAIPLAVEGSEHNGVLLVGGGTFGEKEERLLEVISAQASLALRGVAEAPGGRDVATGLPNRASLYRVLEKELSRGNPAAVVSVRIEGLLRLERDPNLAAGEALLARIARGIGDRRRVFRYGPDELCVLLKSRGEKRVSGVADSIRKAVLDEVMKTGSPEAPEARVGYAVAGPGETDPRPVVAGARRAASSSGEQSAPEEDAGGTIAALLEAAGIKDAGLGPHLRNVRRLARLIGAEMGLGEAEMNLLSFGALLHDVGKIGVPDSILKKPGRLTHEEFEKIKLHTVMGAGVVSQVPELSDAVPIVRHHHERFDGGGYPDGIRGAEIPLASRIVFVADAYASMVEDRPYREGRSHEGALAEIERNAGTQFDPRVVGAFLKAMRHDRRLHSVG